MAKIGSRQLRRVALVAVVIGCVSWLGQDRAFADGDGEGADLKTALTRVAKPWKQPHRLRLSHGGLELSAAAQGGDQWDLTLSEAGGVDRPGLVLSQLGSDEPVLALNYDSATSKYKPCTDCGLKRVAVSAASKESDLDDVDWTVNLEGGEGRQLSITGDQDSIVYDASFGTEVAVPQVKGLSALYAIDAKRKGDASNLLPSSIRQGAGLRYTSQAGDAKVVVHQSEEGAGADVEAVLSGSLEGQIGNPTYVLRASKEKGQPAEYLGKVKLAGPKGVNAGLQLEVSDNKPSLSGYTELEYGRQITKGLEVSADTKIVATPTSEERLKLQPIGLTAKADLAAFLPSLLTTGSGVDVRALYKLGAERPSVDITTKLGSKTLPVQLQAEGQVDSDGKTYGSVRVQAAGPQGVTGRYEAVSNEKDGFRQAAQLSYPLPTKGVDATLYGRVTQREKDHDGKPRLQLGLSYDLDTSIAGKALGISGDSALYDAGDSLIDADGFSVKNLRVERARNSAKVVRDRVAKSDGPGYLWLRK